MTGLVRLTVCVSGVYGAFLLWAIAQERLSKPFPSQSPPHEASKFPSPLFFNWCQALASATCAAIYLLVSAGPDAVRKQGVLEVLGLQRVIAGVREASSGGKAKDASGANGSAAGTANGNGVAKLNGTATAVEKSGATPNGGGLPPRPWHQTLPALLLQVSLFQTTAGPIGFLSLKHISYPTMVLGKSCKLIPVLVLNVLLYRRRFGAHKYFVVSLVSTGISMFMLFGSKKGKGGGDSLWGLALLLVNLIIDGLTNSTQDQIFSLYPGYSGQQMMFIMAFMSLTVLTPAMLLPLPANPWMLLTANPLSHLGHNLAAFSSPILLQSIQFVTAHPTALAPLAAYAALGGLGQLFIFETISHFGSLTLVTITVTRKLFTMLLSVFVFGHKLTPGQWAGVAVVFTAIGIEAGFKRREAIKRVKKDK